MEIFRPLQLGCQQRTLEQDRKFYWVVSATMGIRMSTNEPLLEMDFMKEAIESMGQTPMPDMGMPKPHGEFLLNGYFHSPDGQHVNGGDVSVKLGSVSKTIRVMGPRQWTSYGSTGQEAIQQHWLSYEHAFGGPEFPYNPTGLGFQTESMPQQEYPHQLVSSNTANVQPASFGPVDITWAQRSQFQGTYNNDYMRLYYPGFPKDTDWRFFMAGAQDQWTSGHWQGDEDYELHNLHAQKPLLKGRLPKLKARCFIQDSKSSESGLKELPLKIDTVWFFPESDLMLVIWRGGQSVDSDEAEQISQLMLAYEQQANPKEFAHYQQAYQTRIETDDALLKSINAFDLVPDEHKSALELFKEKAIESDTPSALAENLDQKASDMKALMDSKLEEGKTDLLKNLAQSDAPQIQDLKSQGVDNLIKPQSKQDPLADKLEAVIPGISSGKIESLDFSKLTSAKLDELVKVLTEFSDSKQSEAKSLIKNELATIQAKLNDMPSETLEQKQAKDASMEQLKQLEKMASDEPVLGPLPRFESDELMASLNGKVEPELKQLRIRLANLKSLGSSASVIESAQKQLDDLVLFQRTMIEETIKQSQSDFYSAYKMGAEYMNEGLSPHADDASRRQAFIAAVHKGQGVAGQDWACLDLSGLNLDNVNFSNCLLEQVNFSGCSLKNTIFDGAIACRADFSNAKCTDASFTDVNLGGSNLQSTNFCNSRFSKVTLSQCQFDQTRLEGATFDDCPVLECAFQSVNFSGAHLTKQQFVDNHFTNTDLSRCQFEDSVFVNCQLEDVDFSQTQLPSTNFITCQYKRLNFAKANLNKSSFVGNEEAPLTFSECCFEGADLSFSNLQDAKLTYSAFDYANLSNANLSGTELQHSSFKAVTANKAMLRKANLQHSQWEHANLMEAVMSKSDLTRANFSEANLYGVDFVRSTMGNTRFNGANLDATIIRDWRPA